jgi:hypothetical protein
MHRDCFAFTFNEKVTCKVNYVKLKLIQIIFLIIYEYHYGLHHIFVGQYSLFTAVWNQYTELIKINETMQFTVGTCVPAAVTEEGLEIKAWLQARL